MEAEIIKSRFCRTHRAPVLGDCADEGELGVNYCYLGCLIPEGLNGSGAVGHHFLSNHYRKGWCLLGNISS